LYIIIYETFFPGKDDVCERDIPDNSKFHNVELEKCDAKLKMWRLYTKTKWMGSCR